MIGTQILQGQGLGNRLFCHVLIGNTEYRKLIDPLLFLCAITGYVVDSDVFSH